MPTLSSTYIPVGVLLKLQVCDEAAEARQQQLAACEDGMMNCAVKFREAIAKLRDALATSDNEQLLGHVAGRPVYVPRLVKKKAGSSSTGTANSAGRGDGINCCIGVRTQQLQSNLREQQTEKGSSATDGSSRSATERQVPRQQMRRVLMALRGCVHVWWCLHYLLMQGLDEDSLKLVLSRR